MTEQFICREISIPRTEVLRYLGYGRSAPDDGVSRLLDSCIEEFTSIASYTACRVRTGVSISGETVDLGPLSVKSRGLCRNLSGCNQALLFAATVGAQPDRIIARYRQCSPARAVVLDAVGSAAVEAWCNLLCGQWRSEFAAAGLHLRPRFSPGYGDFPLSSQRELLLILDAAHRAGISLTDTSMMVPRKSVSAVVGLGAEGCTTADHDCEGCGKKDCAFRR